MIYIKFVTIVQTQGEMISLPETKGARVVKFIEKFCVHEAQMGFKQLQQLLQDDEEKELLDPRILMLEEE